MNNIENTQNNPFNRIDHWINNEKRLGSEEPDQVVLATVSKEGLPHSRVVALRQISEDSIVFFTQKNTKKVDDLAVNPYASMTLWLPLQQKAVVLEGA